MTRKLVDIGLTLFTKWTRISWKNFVVNLSLDIYCKYRRISRRPIGAVPPEVRKYVLVWEKWASQIALIPKYVKLSPNLRIRYL